MEYVVEFVRTQEAENPYALVAGRTEYLLNVHSERFGSGRFEQVQIDWDNPLWSVVTRPGATGVELGDDEVQQRVGHQLRTLLDSAGWDRYDAAIADALRVDEPVYMTIRSAAAEIYTLPWELLTVEASGQTLFSLPGVFLGYAWPGASTEPRPRDLDERVLLACSAAGGGVPAAGHLQPLKNTRAATDFDPLRDVVLHASCGKLSDALARMSQEGRPASVLHILCHGSERNGNYGLLLNSDDEAGYGPGQAFVTASDLRRVLEPHVAHLRLVVLAACHSGDAGVRGRHLGGVAQALHRIGIQWVIGSRYPLSVPGSSQFVESFYGRLFGERASVDEAFSAARRQLAIGGGAIDWMSVQLFVRPEHRAVADDIDDDIDDRASDGPDPDEGRDGRDAEPLGPLWRVADEPLHYLPRAQFAASLVEALISEEEADARPTRRKHGVYGMGGIGKSVIAAAVARDPAIRRRFSDGVYWLSFGQSPRLTNLQGELVKALGASVAFDHPSDGERKLVELLSGKRVLVILDDVWEPAHAASFEVVDAGGRMLITTRNLEVLGYHDARVHSIELMSMDQSRQLLAEWAGVDGLPAEADELANACGRLPVALAMVGAMIGGGVHSTARVRKWLSEGRLKKIKGNLHEYEKYRNVYQVIGASVKALTEDPSLDVDAPIARCYAELAVFGEDAPIARTELEVLWGRHGLDCDDVDELCAALAARALLHKDGGYEDYVVHLHDLQRVYTQACVKDLGALHGQLVDAYRARSRDCLAGDTYYFSRFGHHLIRAGRVDELRSLLSDFEWLDAKLRAVGTAELLADYERVAGHRGADNSAHDRALTLIGDALQLASHVLRDDVEQLAGQLWGRLGSYAGTTPSPGPASGQASGHLGDRALLSALLAQIQELARPPWLRPIVASLTPPGGPLLRTLEGIARVQAVAMTPDRRYAVSAACSDTLSVWDLHEGRLLRTLTGHGGWVNAVLVIHDGQLVVSASDDRTLNVWNLHTGALVRTLTGHDAAVTALAATEDGTYVLSGGHDHNVCVWDPHTGALLRTLSGHAAPLNAVAVTPDGSTAVSASVDHVINVWDPDTGEIALTLRGLADSLDITRDGTRAVSASSDQVIEVWDLQAGQLLRTLHGHWASVTDLAVAGSVAGQTEFILSASADGTLKVWELQTGLEVRTLRGHSDDVDALGVSPDGRHAISGSRDQTLKLWDLQARAVHGNSDAHSGTVNAVAITADGHCAVTASSDRTLNVWDVRTGVLVHTLAGHSQSLHALAVTADGACAVTAAYGDTLQVWDLRAGARARVFRSHSIWVNALAVTPDGRTIASAGSNGTVKLWDLHSGALRDTFEGHEGRVDSLAITPDGRHVVSGSRDRSVKVWALDSGIVRHTLTCPSWFASALCITSDGKRVVTTGWQGTLRVWSLESGALLHTVEGPSRAAGFAITPDGRYAVTGAEHAVTAWELESGEPVCRFSTDQPVRTCALAMPLLDPAARRDDERNDGRDDKPVRPTTHGRYRVVVGDESGGVHILGFTP